MSNYTVPDVYVEEIPTLPPSVAAVETALPAFIGYTQHRRDAEGAELAADSVQRIASLPEFEARYGRGAVPTVTAVEVDANGAFLHAELTQTYFLYDAVRLFYANGGGECFIVSVGSSGFPAAPVESELASGLDAVALWDEPTLLVCPDAVSLQTAPGDTGLYALADRALSQCEALGDRMAILDMDPADPTGTDFRDNTGTVGLKYGAAYAPQLLAALPKRIGAGDLGNDIFLRDGVPVSILSDVLTDAPASLVTDVTGAADAAARATAEAALRAQSATYRGILRGLNATAVAVPPSGAVAGLYAFVDDRFGVWRSPANFSISGIVGTDYDFTRGEKARLNVDAVSGKSINAIRVFPGKGTLVYGGRTLAGNSGEYTFIHVRRLMNMIEESIKKASLQFVFEPNSAATWVRLQAMISNFLHLQWRGGAFLGATPEQSYRVDVGLGKTMSIDDVNSGRMIIEIAARPVGVAEIIYIRYVQENLTA